MGETSKLATDRAEATLFNVICHLKMNGLRFDDEGEKIIARDFDDALTPIREALQKASDGIDDEAVKLLKQNGLLITESLAEAAQAVRNALALLSPATAETTGGAK